MSQTATRRGIRRISLPRRARWSRPARRATRVADVNDGPTYRDRDGVRIGLPEVYTEMRQMHGELRSLTQSMNEVVKPRLDKHEGLLEDHSKTLDNLNVKFYGVLAGGVLGMLAVLADALGVFR